MTVVQLLFVAYWLVAALAVRPVAGHFAWAMFARYKENLPTWSQGKTRPQGDQWFAAVTLASLLCAWWPLVAVYAAAGAKLPKVGAEREALLREREQRIRDAERELGLR